MDLVLEARRRVLVMGILNVTPDLFSDGGLYIERRAAVQQARVLRDDGADIIDVGGESTRPGAVPVAEDEELRRVVPVVEAISDVGVAISVDTRHARVAAAAVDAGGRLINDVGGLRDPAMTAVAVDKQVPVMIVHAPSVEIAEFHRRHTYRDVVEDVRDFLRARATAAREAGAPGVIIDPGLGFGKSLDDNLALIRHLGRLTALGFPVLVGASRKRLIGALTGIDNPAQRDQASVALHLAAITRGARLIRVHDVAAHVEALRIWNAVDEGMPDDSE